MLARYTFSRPAEPVLTCATSATKQRHVAWTWTDWTDWLAQPRHPGRPGPWLSLSHLTSPHLDTLLLSGQPLQPGQASQPRSVLYLREPCAACGLLRPSQPASPCSRSRAYRGGTRGSSAQVPICPDCARTKKREFGLDFLGSLVETENFPNFPSLLVLTCTLWSFLNY